MASRVYSPCLSALVLLRGAPDPGARRHASGSASCRRPPAIGTLARARLGAAAPAGQHRARIARIIARHFFLPIKTIKWIGYDRFKLDEISQRSGASPIRIAQFAIDDQTPYRDLYLSSGHCLFFNEILIPVALLVNDASIRPCLPPGLESIEYYHIEFDTHEVIFVDGTCVESYLGSNRATFSNCVEFQHLYGNVLPKTPYAPIAGYFGGCDEVKGLIRSIVSHVIDVRDPIQVAWDQIAARAVVARILSHRPAPSNYGRGAHHGIQQRSKGDIHSANGTSLRAGR
jgi:hypothetical protein